MNEDSVFISQRKHLETHFLYAFSSAMVKWFKSARLALNLITTKFKINIPFQHF